MRQCRLPFVIALECKLAAALHIPPLEARRKPLALALLWWNYTAQVEGMETWWASTTTTRTDEQLDAHIAALRTPVQNQEP